MVGTVYYSHDSQTKESMRGSDGSKGDGSNCNHFSSFGPRPAGSSLGHRRRADRPGSGLSGTSGPTVAREEDAANGPREWNCCSRPGIRALRPRKGHILLALRRSGPSGAGRPAPRRRWERSSRGKEFIWPKRVKRARGVLARFWREGSQGEALAPPRRSPA